MCKERLSNLALSTCCSSDEIQIRDQYNKWVKIGIIPNNGETVVTFDKFTTIIDNLKYFDAI